MRAECFNVMIINIGRCVSILEPMINIYIYIRALHSFDLKSLVIITITERFFRGLFPIFSLIPDGQPNVCFSFAVDFDISANAARCPLFVTNRAN